MPSVGSIHVDARIDGSSWPRDLRRIMDEQGREMARAADKSAATFSDQFQRTLSARMTSVGRTALRGMEGEAGKSGTRLGVVYSQTFGEALNNRLRSHIDDAIQTVARLAENDGLSRFVGEIGDVDEALEKMTRSLAIVQDSGAATDEQMLDLTDSYIAQRAALRDTIAAHEEKAAQLQRERQYIDNLKASYKNWLDEEVARVSLMLRNTNGAFDEHVRRLGSVDRAYADLDHRVRVVGSEMGGAWTIRALNALKGLGDGMMRVGKQATEAGTQVTKGFVGSWKGMSHNTRQWALIIAAIMAGMQHMAAIGSVAGAGITIVGGAAAAALVGVGGLVAAFSGLTKELEELPAALRPTAAAFQGIGDAFGDLRDSIQTTALADAEESFNRMAGAVRDLAPAFKPMARVIGGLIDDFSLWAEEASKADGVLTRLVQGSAPLFDRLARAAGLLGDALLRAFSDPAMQRAIGDLMGWLEGLAQSFSDFVNSADFDKWLGNASRVFGAVGDLLSNLGDMFDDLVSDQAINNLEEMIGSISGMTSGLGNLMGVLGELDIFGVLAKALETVLQLLDPIFRGLEPIAGIVRDGLVAAFDALSLILTPVRAAFEVLGAIWQSAAEYIRPVISAVGNLLGAFSDLANEVFIALRPAFDAIADAFFALFPDVDSFADLLNNVIVPAIKKMSDAFVMYAVPAIQGFADFVNATVKPVFETFSTGLRAVGDATQWVGEKMGFLVPQANAGREATKHLHDETNASAQGWADTQTGAIQRVNDAFLNYMNQVLSSRDANRAFEAAIDAAEAALEENGATLDISTEKGRTNEAALDGIAAATLRMYEETLKNTGSQEQATAALEKGRDELFRVAKQFMGSEEAAQAYIDELGLIPENIDTNVDLKDSDARTRAGRFIGDYDNRRLTMYIDTKPGRNYGPTKNVKMASGGNVYGPTRALIGEAGPEAVVPLSRPLSQVDPSVRWLSALAQGKGVPAMASGGVAGGGRQVVIESGAIVVEDRSGDPRRTAIETVNRIAENVGV